MIWVNIADDITIIHAYTCNKKFKNIWNKKLTELKKEKNNLTTISEDFNIPSPITDTSSRQKTNMDIDDLNNAINQVVLIHTYQTPSNSKLGSFSSTHGTLTSIEQMLGQTRCPNKLKGIKYISNLFWKLT